MTKRVVMYSGGVGSWAAAKRVAARFGTDDMALLFTDTRTEDPELYTFLGATAANVGAELVTIAEGRDVWQVFNDVRFLGNARADPCSRILKREMARQWIDDNCAPVDSVLYVGIDWTEAHRMTNVVKAWAPFTVEAPLTEPPYLSKRQLLAMLAAEGLAVPEMYRKGFPHFNCGGFCIKAGQAHFALLLREYPDRYRYHERQEAAIRERLGDVSILRDRTGGTNKRLTLRAFRERLESASNGACQMGLFDADEWGGCGCFVDS